MLSHDPAGLQAARVVGEVARRGAARGGRMLGIIRQRSDQASPEERLRRAGGDLSRQDRAQEARQGRLHRRGDGRRGGVHRREDRHAEEPRRHGRGPQDAAKDQVDGRSSAEGRAADDKGRHNFGARGAARPAARHDAHAADKAPGRDAAGLDRLQDPARRRKDSLEAPRQALRRPGRRGLRAR